MDPINAVVKKEVGELPYSDKRDNQTDHVKPLIDMWLRDTKWKLGARKALGWSVPIVLLLEICFVYFIVLIAMYRDNLFFSIADYQILISAFSVGVIAQTAYIFNVMVKWLFSDIKYDSHPAITMNNK